MNTSRFSHTGGRDPRTWVIIFCLPGALAGSWFGSRGRTQSQALWYMIQVASSRVLIYCTTMSSPKILFLDYIYNVYCLDCSRCNLNKTLYGNTHIFVYKYKYIYVKSKIYTYIFLISWSFDIWGHCPYPLLSFTISSCSCHTYV